MNFNWKKMGLIYSANPSLEWSKTHTALPTPVILDAHTVRIFYNTRDSEQKSRISYIDASRDNLSNIIYKHDRPVVDLGKLGTFDDVGHTSSCFLKISNDLYYYYINGYNIASPARYRISIGFLKTTDFNSFERIYSGPILDRNIYDPCGVATPYVIKEDGLFKMWYASFIKWERLNNDAEPFYCIKYATSSDAIHWVTSDHICVDLENDEGGIVRPCVLRLDGLYYMWYSVRKNTNYRTDSTNSYRIGFAVSIDGIIWQRKDKQAGIELSVSGWDSEMVAYPYVFVLENKLVMLYNGNGFGQSGFGYAISET